ncbi:MAG TPA: metallophosphoesterase family protein [Actinomycetota bacterium]|nr:metallophosphoesterase family protein [Actinomycetota bacterium]
MTPGSGTAGGIQRLVVLADTHIPHAAKRLPAGLFPHLRRADAILHAGDVTAPEVLEELAGYAPVWAAIGNNDGADVRRWGGTDEVHVDLGVPVAMVHDAGRRAGREGRLRRRFPGAGLIVFGHSHVPEVVRTEGAWLLNPGSPTWKRREPAPTFAVVGIDGDRVRRPRVVALT